MNVVLLSGQIAAGKSTVARLLADQTNGEIVRVRQALAEVLGVSPYDRNRLQVEGADLDRRTGGLWLAEYLLGRARPEIFLIVDSMRTIQQTRTVRRVVESVLVYLDAAIITRQLRFQLAAEDGDLLKRSLPFELAMQHPTELEVLQLRALADVVVNTDEMSAHDVVDEVLAQL